MNGKKLLGYAVASGIILLAGSIVPDFALATMILIFIASLLKKSGQLSSLSSFLSSSTGG